MSDEISSQLIREAARAEVQSLIEMRKIVLEEHSHSFRWLTASLLAVNAGSTVAVLNTNFLESHWKVWSGAAFSAGCFCALLVAVIAQRVNLRVLAPMQAQIGYWVGVSVDSIRDEDWEQKLASQWRKSLRLSWLGQGFGWLSGIAFAVGLVVASFGLSDDRVEQQNVKGDLNCRNCAGSGE